LGISHSCPAQVWRDRIGTEFRDNPGWHGTELMLELVFLLDIVLNFNTTFFEELSGKEVFDRKRISVNYLLNHHHKVYAPLDVLASVPFLVETVCGFTGATMDHSITYFKFFKLWRLGRVVRQFGTMNNRAARALYLFVSFLLINHLMACAYFWMVVRRAPYYGGDETWDGRPSDPMQGETFGRFFPPEGIADVALQRQYLYAYWFVIMLSAGDNPEPTANDQFAFTLSSYLIGLIFNAIIIAEVTSFFATMMDNTGRIQREQMDHVVQTLRYKRVPAKVIHEVRSYLNFQWQTRQGMDAQDVCDLLPRHLARKVQMTLVVTGYAADIPMFSILNQTMKLKLIEHLERHVVAPKETVFKQGEAATSMFWLVRGSMTIWRRDKPGDEPVVLSKLIPGQSSGEAGLFSRDACHDTSAVADGGAWCELAVLSAASLCELIAEDHSILHWLTLSAQKVQRSIADRVHAQAKAQAHRLSVASIDVAQLAALQPKAGSFAKLEHMADPLKAFLESAEHKLLDREEQLAAFVDDHVQQLRRRLHHAFGSDDGTEAVRKDLVAEVQQATSAETFAKGLSSNDEDGALEDTAILHEIVERVEETTDRSDRLRRRDSELKQKLMAVNAFSGGRSFREERTLGAIDHATLSAKAKVHAAAGAVNAFKSHRAAAYEEETEHAKALDAFQRATSRVRSSNYESSKGLHRLTTKDAGLKFRRSVASVGKVAVLAKRSAGGSLRKVRDSLPKVRASAKVRDSLRGADDRGADALPRGAPKD
jgi:CRP-like cAMP-binding protein